MSWAKVQAPKAESAAGRGQVDKGRGRGRGHGKKASGGSVAATGKMSSLVAATLGTSGGVAAGRMNFGVLGATLPGASAKRSRLFPRCDLHFTVSTLFSTPSVTESGEAALRRLLASRAIGGHSRTSDDPAPESLSASQSSRVARPQDASNVPNLVSLLSSWARSYLGTCGQRMLRPVSEVADIESRLVVTLVQFSRRRHNVGFVRDLGKLVPSGLLRMLLNSLVSLSLPRGLTLRGSLLMRVQATYIF